MTISTKTLGSLAVVAAFGLFTPALAHAAPDADGVSEDDIDVDVDEDDDDCDDDDDDCDAEGHVDGGCSAKVAPELGQSIGGLLCTLGLLGWQMRRRRGA